MKLKDYVTICVQCILSDNGTELSSLLKLPSFINTTNKSYSNLVNDLDSLNIMNSNDCLLYMKKSINNIKKIDDNLIYTIINIILTIKCITKKNWKESIDYLITSHGYILQCFKESNSNIGINISFPAYSKVGNNY